MCCDWPLRQNTLGHSLLACWGHYSANSGHFYATQSTQITLVQFSDHNEEFIADSASAKYCSTFQCPCVGVSSSCQKHPTCGIFLKRGLFKDIKNDISMCQTCKYKNTNIQIHKYTNTQIQHINSAVKTHHVAYF